MMPFHKFIPSYHHHFGRQCRVADYGYTKLKDLFDALPHVIQIMGEGRSRAMITLSHRAQVKRFTSDLLRVLKSQASKQVGLMELPSVFEKTLNRKFKISDYGVCDVEDILQEVSETSVVLSGEGDDVFIAIPKREQTQDEMEKTQAFGKECIELLRHSPDCRLPFNKFVPAYHHHFGRQCRVADYGFTKLIELFEAIPLTVEITEDADGERLLQLTDCERLKVLGCQIEKLIIEAKRGDTMPLAQMEAFYRKQFGYPIRPDDYGESNVVQVLKKLPQLLRVESAPATNSEAEQNGSGESGSGSPPATQANGNTTLRVRLIDRTYVRQLGLRVKQILAEQDQGRMEIKAFEKSFTERFKTELKLDQIISDLGGLVELEDNTAKDGGSPEGGEGKAKNREPEKDDNDNKVAAGGGGVFIKLTSLQLCAVKIQQLLECYNDKLLCSEFESEFVAKFNHPLLPGQYGYPSLNSLVRALPDNFVVKGKGARKMIWYLRDGSGGSGHPAEGGYGGGGYGCNSGGGFNDRQTASFFGSATAAGSATATTRPVFGPQGGSARTRYPMNGAAMNAARYTNARHDGYRMNPHGTPTRAPRGGYSAGGFVSHGYHSNGNSPWNHHRHPGMDSAPTSPMYHGGHKSAVYSHHRPGPAHSAYSGSPARAAARASYNFPPPPPAANHAHHAHPHPMAHHHGGHHFGGAEMIDLSKFGLVYDRNGQIKAMTTNGLYDGQGQQRPPSRQHQPPPPPVPTGSGGMPSFGAFTSGINSNNPFLTTPGNSLGLGNIGGGGNQGKLISVSPVNNGQQPVPPVSPVFGGPPAPAAAAAVPNPHSLLPVPHSPLLPANANGMEAASGNAFNFGNANGSAAWMSNYYDGGAPGGQPSNQPPASQHM